jgi:hypothetical protein
MDGGTDLADGGGAGAAISEEVRATTAAGGRRGRGSLDEREEGGTDRGALRAGTRTNGPGGRRTALPRTESVFGNQLF